MQEFKAEFLDPGVGDQGIRGNRHRWMLEYAVLHDVPSALARQYADPVLVQKDAALAVLRAPREAADVEDFSALSTFAGRKLGQLPVITKGGERGKRLFADARRQAAERCSIEEGKPLFTACFGE